MTRLQIDLYICVTGAALWVFVMVYFCIRIGIKKRALSAREKSAPKPKGSYYLALVLSGVLVALPFLILFELYAAAVIEGCAVLGALVLLRDREKSLPSLEP